jgi:hypothetical protein
MRVLRKALLLPGLLWLGIAASSSRADVGHTPVIFEGRAGPCVARISVRAPEVIPGLAEISIRVLEGQVNEATALPIKWNMGRKGAPPPDVARPVPGETNLFSAQLWFMESGAHAIEVTLHGSAGEGRVLLPMNSLATRVLSLPRGLGTGLVLLGGILVLLFVSIIGAAVREALLDPGVIPSRRRTWGARAAMLGAALFVSFALWGGWNWWRAEAAEYRNNRLYRPNPSRVTIDTSAVPARLRLAFEEVDPRRSAPLVPDHGRLMHLFLVREPYLDAMAHLHPVRVTRELFETPLPPLAEGEYALYAQVTHETGLAQTFTNHVHIPGFAPATDARLDFEDAWWAAARAPSAGGEGSSGPAALGDGLQMELRTGPGFTARTPVSLAVRVTDAKGAPVALEPYLGMLGHVVLRSVDGRVFSHIHPSGSFSMAAQQLFELRDAGKAPLRVEFGANDPTCRLPTVEESTAAWLAQRPTEATGEVSFPYEFTQSGPFALWVQVRVRGEVRTAKFNVTVRDTVALSLK